MNSTLSVAEYSSTSVPTSSRTTQQEQRISSTSATASIHGSPNGLNLAYIDLDEISNSYEGNAYKQTAILHEVGHYLGLSHPGGNSNEDSAYEKDAGSLMGMGNEMRSSDFEKAFCSQLVKLGGNYPNAK